MYPRLIPVADCGLLVEFGDRIDPAINTQVATFDRDLTARGFQGFTESVPSWSAVFVGFEPLVTDHAAVQRLCEDIIATMKPGAAKRTRHEVLACYDHDFAPDLATMAEKTKLSPDAIIAAHLAGTYVVGMMGFAPGYAYLDGLIETIRLPRKTSPVRGVPKGSIMLAGSQCIVSTVTMPSGWWVIGRSPTRILRPENHPPVLFDMGDEIVFKRIDRKTFDALSAEENA
jgi:inhibitor of KinA